MVAWAAWSRFEGPELEGLLDIRLKMASKRRGEDPEDGAEAKRVRRLELAAEHGDDEDLMGDVEVVAGGVVHCAKPLLLAQSDVFHAMLTSGLREATQRRIELPDMSADCWRALYAYLQSGDAHVEESATAVELLQAAHMYELAPLVDAVEQRFAAACDEGECDKDALHHLLDLAESLQMAKLTASAARALFVDFQATEKALAAKAAGPLPGGYAVGEKVFYAGGQPRRSTARATRLTHGQAGEVTGASTGSHGDKGVDVMFPGNKGNVSCHLTSLSRSPPPPLPGGYAVGEKLYFTGTSETFPSGNKVTHGQEGEVTGHPWSDSPAFGKGVAVMFPGNKGNIAAPHRAQPHAAAAAAGRVRRRREGVLHRDSQTLGAARQAHARPGGRGDGARRATAPTSARA